VSKLLTNEECDKIGFEEAGKWLRIALNPDPEIRENQTRIVQFMAMHILSSIIANEVHVSAGNQKGLEEASQNLLIQVFKNAEFYLMDILNGTAECIPCVGSGAES
jgi:hypothetical protein